MSQRIEVKSLGGGKYDIVVYGEDHTLGNLIAARLVRKPGVKMAYYTFPHPLEERIILHLTLEDSVDPLKLLDEVLQEIMREAEEFIGEYKRALKEKSVDVEELEG